MGFVNRKRELADFDRLLGRNDSEFLVLYGRRRIGKTALINHWMGQQSCSTAYWVAHRSSSARLLASFSEAVSALLPGVDEPIVFRDWESALRQVFTVARRERVILAIDEFPYLMESVPEFTSLLQAQWDQRGDSQLFLILSGSHYHMMYSEFLAGKGPLYGRATSQLRLEGVELDGLRAFLPRYSANQCVETFATVGGVPKYLELWDDKRPVFKNIEELLLSTSTIFRNEALFLIQDEIPEPRTYLAILEALGCGYKRPVELAESSGIAINHIGKYLKTLLLLQLVRREVSLDAENRAISRLSRYEICDPYLRFYFQYVTPHLSWIERGRTEKLMAKIRKNFPSFVGKSGFEELCRRRIIALGDIGDLPFEPDQIGHLWNNHAEIDVAAVNKIDQQVLLGECKWERSSMGVRHLESLKVRGDRFQRLHGYKKTYALFSKSGFTAELEERADQEGVLLFDGAA